MEYVPIYSPADLGESAFLESLLQSGGIRYYIHGEVTTRVYPQLSLNQRTIYVHPSDFKSAYALMRDFVGGSAEALPDIDYEEQEPPQSDNSNSTNTQRYPYWILVLLAVYVIYKAITN